jgi:hypothetical protein
VIKLIDQKKLIMNKKFMVITTTIIMLLITAGFVYAAFADRGDILGSKFSIGSADLKLYQDISLGPEPDNLVDQLNGPEFTNISSNWFDYYPIKIFNNGTSTIALSSNADYETANDPDDLRQLINVEIYEWEDTNNNGVAEDEEMIRSWGLKSIVKWKTEGYLLDNLEPGQTRGFLLEFSTQTIGDTKQGASGIFDFIFDSVEIAQ